MLPIINILLIVGILLFILYNLYVDTRNWSNTGSFLEGMENAEDASAAPRDTQNDSQYSCSTGGSYATYNSATLTPAQKAKVEELYPGKPASYYACAQGCSGGCSATGDGVMKSVVDAPSAAPAAAPAVAAPSGFKFVSTGKPVEDISQEECKTFTDKLDGYSFSVINESGNPKGCMFQDGTPPGSKGVYYNTGGTADCGVFNGVSKCVVKDTVGAGSASSAMEDQIKARAGNVAPMASSVPQNCKTGCIAPTGPNGNCEIIQKDGVEKRECYYGCPNPTMERNTENCAYDRDCNSCGTVLFNPDDPPDMGQNQQPMQMAQGQGAMAQGQMAQGTMAQGQMAQGQMVQGQTAQGQMADENLNSPLANKLGSMELNVMNNSGSTIEDANNSLFNENIMKQVLENKDLIPGDINSNNEETSYNLRIGKNFMINTAIIRNFALPNIDNQDYIELGRIVKSIKMREADPQEADQVKTLYTKLNAYVLELLTDSSLDMTSYDNRGVPKQLNNKTRTTGMFSENSNSKIKERGRKQKVKPYNSVWSLYQ